MNTIFKSEERGQANHGWLKTRFSFSFAEYYNPEQIHFGALRVLNDDFIDGGGGFPFHPHDNMEIITIPFTGALEHKDNMGHQEVIHAGDVQVMSAGTGIYHSEFNHSATEPVTLFQIWIFPNKRDVKPRYDQVTLNIEERKNKLQQIVSPKPDDEGSWIHQDAWLYMGNFDKDITVNYDVKREDNGLYLMVIKGKLEVDGEHLETRDAIGIYQNGLHTIKSLEDATEFLLIDIPLKF